MADFDGKGYPVRKLKEWIETIGFKVSTIVSVAERRHRNPGWPTVTMRRSSPRSTRPIFYLEAGHSHGRLFTRAQMLLKRLSGKPR